MVVGAEPLGLEVAVHLRDHQERVIVVDDNQDRLSRAEQREFEIVLANVAENDLKAENTLNQAQTLICTLEDNDKNYAVCHIARMVYGIKNVVAQVDNPGQLAHFQSLGVSTLNAVVDHGALLAMLARNPATFALLTRTNDDKEVYEVLVENQTCIGQTLRNLKLPGDTLALAIQRNGEVLVPHGDSRLEPGDTLTLVSSLEWTLQAHRLFSQRD